VEAHPDAARCDYALNEGGGERLVLDGTPVYLCTTAEKMSAPFRVRIHGRSGHASMPGIADNALVKAARYLEALGSYDPPRELIPEARGFLEAVLGEVPPLEQALARAGELHPMLPPLVEPLLAFTLSPTMIDASHQRNVIPAVCEITVDCRLLPETTPADVEPLIRAALGDGRYDLEFMDAVGGTRSPLATPLWDVLERFTAEVEPGARLAPIACAGFTDSHFLRTAYGTTAYGFFPLKTMDAELATKLVHSANERIPVDDLVLGVDMLRFAARTLLGT
jgi:acetylornithine deacetylase/succinyl-diaminopimelate desuccinylase-like protein